MIDYDDYAIRILRPAANALPQGQVIDAAPVFGVKAGQIGQVFGVALDDAAVPNIYLAAAFAQAFVAYPYGLKQNRAEANLS
jgi:hypothetical protein